MTSATPRPSDHLSSGASRLIESHPASASTSATERGNSFAQFFGCHIVYVGALLGNALMVFPYRGVTRFSQAERLESV